MLEDMQFAMANPVVAFHKEIRDKAVWFQMKTACMNCTAASLLATVRCHPNSSYFPRIQYLYAEVLKVLGKNEPPTYENVNLAVLTAPRHYNFMLRVRVCSILNTFENFSKGERTDNVSWKTL